MPSAITEPLIHGPIDFRAFMLRAARGMSALSRFDGPIDAPIPVFQPRNEYSEERLKQCQKDLADTQALSGEEVAKRCREEYERACLTVRDANAAVAVYRARAERLIELVSRWCPPSQDHEGLKSYALNQLREFLRWDCSLLPMPSPVAPSAWREQRIASLQEDIAHYEKNIARETEQTMLVNAWVQMLRDGLPEASPPPAPSEAPTAPPSPA
jgi:hypothetical protein